MAPQSNLLVFGAGAIGSDTYEVGTAEGSRKTLEVLKAKGVTHIDTAQLYGSGNSEATLGRLNAVQNGFTIDTKWISGWTGSAWASEEKIVQTAKESLEKLNVDVTKGESVDIFYLHSPDLHTPFEQTLKGVDQAYRNGGFKRFGLSNFTPDMTKEVLEICEKNGYIKPTAYQGSYSAAARKAEDELIPLLRQHKIAFYAYSPISGGFLTKNRKFVEDQQGRFSKDAVMGIYHKMYTKENFMSLLDKWEAIAKQENVSQAELAFRWVNYHSALKPECGDAIIFGSSKWSQIEATTQYLRNGPLSDQAVKEIDALWPMVKDDSIIDNFQAVFGGSG